VAKVDNELRVLAARNSKRARRVSAANGDRRPRHLTPSRCQRGPDLTVRRFR
jgi:hypothetical protein